MSQNLEQWKRQFLEYIEIEKGRSMKTVANYDHYLSRFLKQTKLTEPAQITDNVVREFRLWLNRQPISLSGKRNGQMGETLKSAPKITIWSLYDRFLSILCAKALLPSLLIVLS